MGVAREEPHEGLIHDEGVWGDVARDGAVGWRIGLDLDGQPVQHSVDDLGFLLAAEHADQPGNVGGERHVQRGHCQPVAVPLVELVAGLQDSGGAQGQVRLVRGTTGGHQPQPAARHGNADERVLEVATAKLSREELDLVDGDALEGLAVFGTDDTGRYAARPLGLEVEDRGDADAVSFLEARLDAVLREHAVEVHRGGGAEGPVLRGPVVRELLELATARRTPVDEGRLGVIRVAGCDLPLVLASEEVVLEVTEGHRQGGEVGAHGTGFCCNRRQDVPLAEGGHYRRMTDSLRNTKNNGVSSKLAVIELVI